MKRSLSKTDLNETEELYSNYIKISKKIKNVYINNMKRNAVVAEMDDINSIIGSFKKVRLNEPVNHSNKRRIIQRRNIVLKDMNKLYSGLKVNNESLNSNDKYAPEAPKIKKD